MGEVQELQMQIRGEADDPLLPKKKGGSESLCDEFCCHEFRRHLQPEEHKDVISEPATTDNGEQGDSLLQNQNLWWRWFLVILNIFFLIAGQSSATLLGRFYFDKGGNSKWMASIVQAAGWPILAVILPFFPFFTPTKIGSAANIASTTSSASISTTKYFLIYFLLALLIAADDLLYSYGLDYLPISTYSLICSSQLAFNAVFSFYLNKQKFTPLILNSLVLLTFSGVLLALNSDSDQSTGNSTTHYAIGFVCTVSASALYSFILSLVQFLFQRVIKEVRFSTVLKMQIYPSVYATFAMILGLFLSGEWKDLKGEMMRFETGKVSYVNTLFWTAVGWQVCSVGTLGLILFVSSLFSNAISAVALPVVPILSVFFFHDNMGGIKIMAMLIGLWGLVSYIYQNYLDSSPRRTTKHEL